jgi:hypothetical protein
MVEQNMRAVYEPLAVCTEETNRQSGREMKMRVRIIAQTLTDLWRHRAIMNPLRGGFYAVQLLSHKVMRYFVPFFLIALLVTSAILMRGSLSFQALLALQLLGYGGGVLAWLLDRVGVRSRLLVLPQYFLLANIASLIAFYKFLRGERYARWEPMRDSAPIQPQRTHVQNNA